MSTGDIIVLAVVLVLVLMAFSSIRKKSDDCDNICNGCAFASGCTRKQKESNVR